MPVGGLVGPLSEGILKAYLLKFQEDMRQRQQQESRLADQEDWERRQLFINAQRQSDPMYQFQLRAAQAEETERGVQQTRQRALGEVNAMISIGGGFQGAYQRFRERFRQAYFAAHGVDLPTRVRMAPGPSVTGTGPGLARAGLPQPSGTELDVAAQSGLTPWQEAQMRARELEFRWRVAKENEQLAIQRGDKAETKRWHDIQGALTQQLRSIQAGHLGLAGQRVGISRANLGLAGARLDVSREHLKLAKQREARAGKEPLERIPGIGQLNLSQVQDEIYESVNQLKGLETNDPTAVRLKARIRRLAQARDRLERRKKAVGKPPVKPSNVQDDPLGILKP